MLNENFPPPTILLGLLLCPWMLGIFGRGGSNICLSMAVQQFSCGLGVLTGDNEHRSFHSAIFVLGSMLIIILVLTDYKSEVPMTSYLG